MIDGRVVVDAHVHVPRLRTVKPSWLEWAEKFGKDSPWREVYDSGGDPVPANLDALLAGEGVDLALLFSEYSPRATGIQPVEDLLPIIAFNPERFRLVGCVNPELHSCVEAEVTRQLDLGAIALKVHPVHGGFRPDDAALCGAYRVCAERGIPVIVHTGPSTFPGAQAHLGDPALLIPVMDEFPGVTFVLAHGGRGSWYNTAASMALERENVWLDLAGLPPKKLPDYYARFDLGRLAAKWIFGTDWPGVPGAANNVRALSQLGLPADRLAAVLAGNAAMVFPGLPADISAAFRSRP